MSAIWDDDLPRSADRPWDGGLRTLRMSRGELLGATLHELPPGAEGPPYHFHHGVEEMLIVLKGRPTLRTPQGERVMDEGEVVVFPRGPEGAHKCSNPTAEPARYLFVSNRASPDAVEYPDTGALSVMAYTNSQFGRPLWDMRVLPPPGDEA